VAASIARVHGDLLLIHPFREGNGRVAHWLADLMAQQAGLPAPEWRLSGRRGGRNAGERYLECVRSAYVEDYRPLADFVAEAIETALAERSRASTGRSPRAPSKTEES
jgi:cell filamentation protein